MLAAAGNQHVALPGSGQDGGYRFGGQGVGIVEDEQLALHLQNYSTQTIRLRNIMEFELFDEELDRLTDEAIMSVGGKLDAYQRMFDEEVDKKELDRQFDAAKYIFNRTEKFDEKAGILTEEIMKNVILTQSKPNTP